MNTEQLADILQESIKTTDPRDDAGVVKLRSSQTWEELAREPKTNRLSHPGETLDEYIDSIRRIYGQEFLEHRPEIEWRWIRRRGETIREFFLKNATAMLRSGSDAITVLAGKRETINI